MPRPSRSKSIADAVRATYERHPYPPPRQASPRAAKRCLPPADWLRAMLGADRTWPRRILVAGCGTGPEAFALRRMFPRADIVGIDYAAGSIRVAQRQQRRAAVTRDIHFLCADLTAEGLPDRVGRDFDFISCHGVLSYLAEQEKALRNLARCLAPSGALYLGVNGPQHLSESWRRFLPHFEVPIEQWTGERRHRRCLKLAAALSGESAARLLRHGPAYLASDLFGALITNRPLADWARMARRVGLHLCSNFGLQRALWPAINGGLFEAFLPRGRGEVAQLLDLIRPAAFYRLVFSRRPEPVVPWQEHARLLEWRPLRSEFLRHFQWPRKSARIFRLENVRANILIELRGAGWEIDLLRASDGVRSLRELVAALPSPPSPAALRTQLYLFYLLELLNLSPPSKAPRQKSPRRA